jgi:hypothetical protein
MPESTVPVTYQPGTAKSPQLTKLQTAAFAETNRVHFPDGVFRTLPEWQDDLPLDVDILGALRTIFATQLAGTYQGYYYFYAASERLCVRKLNTLYNITPLQTTAAATLGSNPITTTTTPPADIITVAYTAHGLAAGDRIRLSGATDVGGLTASSVINKEHIVNTTPTADTFTLDVGANASSVATGGGASVVLFKQVTAGNLTQGLATGLGAGLFGGGLYGLGSPSVAAQSYPRIPSLDVFGNEVVMCLGDYTSGDGQKVYIWDGNTTVAPTALTNAPTDCNFVFTCANAIVALCGDTIKISETGNGTVWTPGSGTNAYQNQLQRVTRLIAGVRVTGQSALLFTEREVLLLRYVGDPNYWEVDDVMDDDGLISPSAVMVLNGVPYWMGWRGWYRYAGSYPERLENTQNQDWIYENLNYAQNYSVHGFADTQNNQLWWFFPTGVDEFAGSYVIHALDAPSWTLGELSRTACQRPSFVGNKCYMGFGDSASVAASVWRHFVTNTALDIGWSARQSFATGDDATQRMTVRQFYPDSNQSGDMQVSVITKEYQQSAAESTAGPYTVTSTTEYVTTSAAGRVMALEFSGQKRANIGSWKITVSV